MILNLSHWGKRVQRMLQKPNGSKKPVVTTNRWNIVRGDLVEVTQGPQEGQRGKIKAVLRDTNRVIIEGVNLRKRYIRPRQPGESGRTVIMPVSVHYSNVQLIDPVEKYDTVSSMFLTFFNFINSSCYACFSFFLSFSIHHNSKPTKISRKYLEDGTKVRVSKLTGQVIPKPDFSQVRKPRSFCKSNLTPF